MTKEGKGHASARICSAATWAPMLRSTGILPVGLPGVSPGHSHLSLRLPTLTIIQY
jgi:hypothetical protein